MVPFTDLELACDSKYSPGKTPSCLAGRQNSHGFRVPEYTISRPPETFRIVILGDSFTWGWGVSDDETFVLVLKAKPT